MKSYRYLNTGITPDTVKKYKPAELSCLCAEIRGFLIENVTKCGGHLASNLGMVELTVAMHRVFDSPKDHFIFDVGHQSYVHKLLTGRMADFYTLRQNGGLSGFTKRSESIHDPFGAGHASTSLSAAVGMADADAMKGNDAYTVCVIGDGAFTGGMIHEALNNLHRDRKLIIILNENEMSISHTTGSYAGILSQLRTTAGYYSFKEDTKSLLSKIPHIGNRLTRLVGGTKQHIKNFFYHSNFFEDFGLYYLGPADGNDLPTAETLLRIAKDLNTSVIIHFKTTKGKGFEPAEKAPDIFHAIAPMAYDRNGVKVENRFSDSYSEVFGDTMLSILKERNDVRVITAAMTAGTGLRCVAEQTPQYLTDVGIAEEHAVTYAAGLSAGGIHPVVAIYSSFLQRSYDNLIHDVALQNLPLTICIDRAGFNEGDGPTHHGIFDVAMLSELPNADIYTPLSYDSLRTVLRSSVTNDKLTAIRYPKGIENNSLCSRFAVFAKPNDPLKPDFDPAKVKSSVLIVTYGRIAAEAVKAEEQLAKDGISAGVLLLERLTPYADRAAEIGTYLTEHTSHLIFLEEGIYSGGAAMRFHEELSEIIREKSIHVSLLAIKNPFAPSEKGKRMAETAGIDAAAIIRCVREKYK